MIGNREAIHPTSDRLAAFALGRLDDSEAAALADHLGGCEACQQAVRAVPDDSMLALLRPSGSTPLPQPPLHGVTTCDNVAPPDKTPPPDGQMLVPGYEVLGVLGRGGMGVVYKARHLALNRLVALKVIRDGALAGAEALTRFRTEAQALARLQHPNIVQVHEVGEFGGLPFFSLEFCTGGNLDDKLNGTPLLPMEAARLVEVLALAMHAAHQQKVVHRDLKPANVLLAADGTPKITDFGLAKKLDDVSVTHSGAIMGTPSYMAPEQAAGKQDEVGPLADVYALGAILYECLTGRPPFRAPTMMDTLAQVLADDPVPPRQLQSRTPRDLDTICLKCLQKERGKRYPTAAELAEDLRRYQARLPIRARPVGGVERAWRWCRRHPSRAALAAAVMLIVAGAAAGAVWYQQDSTARAAEHTRKAANTERDVTGALEEAMAFAKQAAGLHDDPTKWEAALVEAQSAVKRADGVLNSGVDDTGELRPRVDAVQADLAAAERDRRMIAGLEAARFQGAAGGKEGGFDVAGAVALYAAAFRKDDEDWDALEPDEAAARINRRAIREELLAALFYWYSITAKDQDQDREKLRGILQAADPDPTSLQNRWKAAVQQKDLDGLRRLAASSEVKDQPTARLVLFGRILIELGAAAEAVKFLKEANERRPGDFWIAFGLASASSKTKPPATDEAIRYYTAALMLRPNCAAAHDNLGAALCDKHQLDEAIAEHRKALQIQPDFANAHNNLGAALHDKGQRDEAIAEYRKALQIRPDFAEAHNNLGNALYDKGQLDEAIAEYRKALQIRPDFAAAHYNLGNALRHKHQLDEAIAEFRKALQIQPNDAGTHNNLGNALQDKGKFDEAIAEYRKALQIRPDLAEAHNNLGIALYDKGQRDEAIAEYRKAIELKPDYAHAHSNLGNALKDKGQWDEAITEFRKALQIRPDFAVARNNLGNALDLAECDALLPAILRGEAAPFGAVQQVRFADFCQRYKRLYATASRFYADAFAAEPGLAEDLSSWNRLNAACAAALAGCGQGEDAAKTDAKERSRWRKQALDWLRADLALWTKVANGANPQGRAATAQMLRQWQEVAALAGVRDADALAKLPADEQDAWRKLWTDVDAVLQKAQEK